LHRRFKGKLVVGLAAIALIAFAGGAFAATESSGPSTRQAFLNDVAKRLHVTPQQLSAALNGATVDELQAAVKDGRLTQSQANALEQREKKTGATPGLGFGFFGPGAGGGPGLGLGPGPGPGGGPGFGPRLRGVAGPLGFAGGIGSAASYLGLSNAQVFRELSSGKSLAQIATAKGKSVSGLEQAMTAASKAQLAKAVANKMLTAAQEKQLLSGLSSRIANQVNQKGLQFPKLRAPMLRFNGAPSPPKGAPSPPNGPSSKLGPAAPLFAPASPTA
jgi:hypothetical protein